MVACGLALVCRELSGEKYTESVTASSFSTAHMDGMSTAGAAQVAGEQGTPVLSAHQCLNTGSSLSRPWFLTSQLMQLNPLHIL